MERVREAVAKQELNQEAIGNVLQEGAELSLLYGETPLESVEGALKIIKDAPSAFGAQGKALLGDGSEVFVDVGSGRGHVVLAAAASMKWSRCIGIELEQAHVDEANKALETLRADSEGEASQPLATPTSAIQFICGDALNNEEAREALKSAKIVYCFDLAFPTPVRQQLAALFAEILPENCILVSGHSDPFPSAAFAPMMPVQTIKMEWGPAPMRVYRKGPGGYDLWQEQHYGQLQAAGVPASLHEAAYRKITELDFDIGSAVQLARASEDSSDLFVVSTKDLKADEDVFVLDHAWTFASRADAAASLANVPGLLDRLWDLCGEQTAGIEKPSAELLASNPEEAAKRVLSAAGNLLASYVIRHGDKEDDVTTVYYLLDEVGSRIRRRRSPVASRLQPTEANFRVVPIYSFDYRMAFQLAWPVTSVETGNVLVADHEQGWDLNQEVEVIDSSKETSDSLPEMKEFAAQAALRQMMDQSRQEQQQQQQQQQQEE